MTVDDFIDGYVAYVHETRTRYDDEVTDAKVGSMIGDLQRNALNVMRPYLTEALAGVWEDGWNKSERLGYVGYVGFEDPGFYDNPYRKDAQ